MNNTIPLEETIPWSHEIPRTILIADSIETDGRFLLHTCANQILKHPGGSKLWWITASPVSDRHIANGLKKIGCDVAASYLRNHSTSLLKITSLGMEMTKQILLSSSKEEVSQVDPDSWTAENYLKTLYQQIKSWIEVEGTTSTTCHWLFLDDMSALATMVGDEGLVFQFMDSLCSLAMRRQDLGLMIRCSHELDQTLLKTSHIDETQDKTGWLGAGGLAQKQETQRIHQSWIPWERTIESMDIVVDVIPLTSGYSREAHGRLVFTEYPGGRRWSVESKTKQSLGALAAPLVVSPWNKLVINYCLQDNGVRAIRLRETTAAA